MQLNKYQAILISKLVTEYLKDSSNDLKTETGLMCLLEEDLGRFILESSGDYEVSAIDSSLRSKN
jgi:hypothetical protein